MKKVLIVEDSKTVITLIKNELKGCSLAEIVYANSYKEAMRKIRENRDGFHAAILDLNLPDAPNGEVVSLATSHNIPTIVLTGTINENLKELILKKDVVDFILKNDTHSIKLAVNAMARILKNYDTTIMIVDDSKLYRETLKNSLKLINLNTIEVKDGQEALDYFEKNREHDISLVITDYEMPNVNGQELTYKLREKYKKDQLGIIAISSAEEEDITSQFLKYGANDFINKPFTHNEIVTRVNSNLELLDLFSQIRDMANKDFLTGAYNRRYFFDSGSSIFKKSKRKDTPLVVAMIDIDKFKNINDTYGHDVGDVAIQEIKRILDKELRASDLMARFGGEEFCILLEDITLEETQKLFEKIRISFEKNIIDIDGLTISYTVSTGIYYGLADTLDEMVKLSDEALYSSKESGRNRVTINS